MADLAFGTVTRLRQIADRGGLRAKGEALDVGMVVETPQALEVVQCALAPLSGELHNPRVHRAPQVGELALAFRVGVGLETCDPRFEARHLIHGPGGEINRTPQSESA